MSFEKQRNVDVSAWDYTKPVVLKRLTAGESEAYTNESTKGSMKVSKNKSPELDVAMGTASLLYVKACIVDAPWANTLDELRKLDGTLIDYLYEQAQEVNASPLAKPTSSD
jgi:hypothetical protein